MALVGAERPGGPRHKAWTRIFGGLGNVITKVLPSHVGRAELRGGLVAGAVAARSTGLEPRQQSSTKSRSSLELDVSVRCGRAGKRRVRLDE